MGWAGSQPTVRFTSVAESVYAVGMKKLLALFPVLVLLTGCVSMTNMVEKLKDDPAIVAVRMGTPWGTQILTRIGGTTNAVDVLPDGTVRINPR